MIYGIMALGAYITYKILDFPDLTVDGSFPLGAAVTAALISTGRKSLPDVPSAAALRQGPWPGMCTGLIHVKGKVRDLLSGIIMMTALYTINLPDRRQIQCADVQYENGIFDNDFINSSFRQALTPVRSTDS